MLASWSLAKSLLAGAACGLLLAAVLETGSILFSRNLHAVEPGRVYRAAQMPPELLGRKLEELGIRTLVNLRGCCDRFDWYQDECRTTHALGVSQEDVCLSAGRLPSTHEVRYLVRVLDQSDYPILLHCQQGADRTGLVSALYLLLHTDAEPRAALRHFGPRYGHVPIGGPARLAAFFDYYQEWLDGQAIRHSPAAFRRWLEQDYCPGECRCRIEAVDLPDCVPARQAWSARFRVTNTSIRPWRLLPERHAGIHLGFVLADHQGRQLAMGRSGLFEALVAPGESIELTASLPALKRGGRYFLFVDMVDEQHCWFTQAGSEPFIRELRSGE